MDLVWLIVSFLVTLLIFSYIFGDNPLFRLASYAFVGVAAGYAAVVVVEQVLLPKLILPLAQGNWLLLVPLALGVILLLKLVPRYSRLGSLPMAFLVGVAAAVAIGGAVFGTLIGQTRGAINDFGFPQTPGVALDPAVQIVEAVLVLVGTLCTLIYFQFGARAKPGQAPARSGIVETLSQVGQLFLSITLGSLFAGVFAASITALIERLDFLQKFVTTVLLPK